MPEPFHAIQSLYSSRKLGLPLTLSVFFFLAAVAICPWVGATHIDIAQALSGTPSNTDMQILIHGRLPRIALAAMTGAALALAGVGFQALLRNPLADPYTLGLASGASLGAVLTIKLGLESTLIGLWAGSIGLSVLPLSAFAGCMLIVGLVYGLAASRGKLPATTLLLAGVCISFFVSAIILFLLYWRTDFVDAHQIIRWTMGSLAITDFGPVGHAAPFFIIGSLLLLWQARPLNLLAGGEAVAHSRGVDVRRAKQVVFVGASVSTAAVIAISGPIGFVGIIVPHTTRLLFGADHRLLMPCSLFVGAGFLVICDTICRTLMAPLELPVGILTALIGAPFFIWLLCRKQASL